MNEVTLGCEISCQGCSRTAGHVVTSDWTSCNAQCPHQCHSNASHNPALAISTTTTQKIITYIILWTYNYICHTYTHYGIRINSLDRSSGMEKSLEYGCRAIPTTRMYSTTIASRPAGPHHTYTTYPNTKIKQ